MAAGYEMPNWIQPPDLAGQYARGLQLGQQAAMEQQRLQQQQMQSEREHMLETQRLQISKAYQDQQIQLRQQELKQSQAELKIKTDEAGRRLAAQQQYQQWLGTGGDPVTGLLRFGPAMGDVGAGYGQLAREERMKSMVRPPPGVETFDVEGQPTSFLHYTQPTGTEEFRQIRPGTENTVTNKRAAAQVRQMEREEQRLRTQLDKEAELVDLTAPDAELNARKKADKARYLKMQQDADDLRERVDAYYDTGEVPTPAARPAPPTGPAAAAPGAAAGGIKIIAIRPKQAAPASPAAPTVPAPIPSVVGGLAPIAPQGMGGPVAPPAAAPIAAPSVPGAPFLPGSISQVTPPRSSLPTTAPGPLFESGLTANTAAYGSAVRTAQDKLRKAFADLKPVDLVAAAKRLGESNIAWSPEQGIFFAPSMGGLFSNSINREDLESRLTQMATEKNLNPLQ